MYTNSLAKTFPNQVDTLYQLTVNQFDSEFEEYSSTFNIDVPVYVNTKMNEDLIEGHETRKQEREHMLSLRKADIIIETHQVVCNNSDINTIVDRLVARGYDICILNPNSFMVVAKYPSDAKKKKKISIFKLKFHKKVNK